VGSVISPVSASTSAIACGNGNTINGTNTFIAGGTANTVSTSTASYCAIVGGSTNRIGITNTTSAGSGIFCGNNNLMNMPNNSNYNIIVGGNGNTMSTSGSSASQNTIVGGLTNTISNTTGGSFIAGGTANTIGTNGSSQTYCAIVGGTTNQIGTANTTSIGSGIFCGNNNLMNMPNNSHYNVIIGGNGNTMSTNGNSASSSQNTIVGGSSNTISINSVNGFIGGGSSNSINTSGIAFTTNCAILGGSSNVIGSGNTITTDSAIICGTSNTINTPNTVNRHLILGGTTNSITCTGGSGGNVILGGTSCSISGSATQSIASGVLCSVSHNNNFMWADGSRSPSTFPSTGANRFMILASGGSFIYSNSTLTTGVSLAAGGTSWGIISDQNQKKNILPLDHRDILSKVRKIEVYEFSMKDQPDDQICYGTMAQEWNRYFGCKKKDPLQIDSGDLMGVLLSCIKSLTTEIDLLKERKLS
jgi:hypothetical protein